ncbi:hypothetical protein LDENG_00077660, partial [Lucifuga dentata]
REERFVHLVEKRVILGYLCSCHCLSGLPPFIPKELLEHELFRFGTFVSEFRTVVVGWAVKTQWHVQSVRRQTFMSSATCIGTGQTERDLLDSDISFSEMTMAVQQLSCGRSPGINRLPSEFYKCIWTFLGRDLHEVFRNCYNSGSLPLSCTRAVLTLLPKKGDLGQLKNWRLVSLLCTDYKIFAKCFSNRLKECMDSVVHCCQTYCVPGRLITDNIALLRDFLHIAKLFGLSAGLVSIDQEKAFDRVEHNYLWNCLNAFGFNSAFIGYIKAIYCDRVF